MVNIIIQLSKYVIIILMAAYTFSCFSIFTRNYEDEEKRVLIRQDVLMFLLQFARVWYNVFGNKRYSDLVFICSIDGDSSCGHSFV